MLTHDLFRIRLNIYMRNNQKIDYKSWSKERIYRVSMYVFWQIIRLPFSVGSCRFSLSKISSKETFFPSTSLYLSLALSKRFKSSLLFGSSFMASTKSHAACYRDNINRIWFANPYIITSDLIYEIIAFKSFLAKPLPRIKNCKPQNTNKINVPHSIPLS